MTRATLLALALLAPAALAQPPVERPHAALPGESILFRFEHHQEHLGMAGWQPARTGGAAVVKWAVIDAVNAPSGARALVLVDPAATGNAFNLCVYPLLSVADVAASTWLKPVSGTEDQGGGLAWRIQSLDGVSADDYYCARWNPLENNLRVYVVKAGVRTQLASADVAADPARWHALSVAHIGSRIEVTLDGGARLTVEDSTFSAPGLVGLWTKADAATLFDDVSIADATPPPATTVDTMRRDARLLHPLVQTDLARAFLSAAQSLPHISPTTIFFDRQARIAYSAEQAAALDPEKRAAMREITADEQFYYYTRYGSPLAYARAIDLAGAHGLASARGARILDFGYGSVGHLRMLATLGAEAIGVEVDPVLPILYGRPADTGRVGAGRITLIDGSWPGDATVRALAGDRLDLFLSKNTLKNGYIHPAQDVDPRMLVHLGVSDEEYLHAVHDALKPGGLFLIYNICPAPSAPGQPYKPWADGRCPFPPAMLQAAGFKVLAFDVVDDKPVRDLGRALGWNRGDQHMDIENDLFAWYTIAQKP